MFNFYRIAFVVLFVFIVPLISSAKEKPSNIEKLSKQADIIATGKVKQMISSWNANKTRIFTKATLEVDEMLKGDNNSSAIEVICPGGEVGEVGELYTHMPSFKDNEEVLVFLIKNKKEKYFNVLNGETGKISLIRDAHTEGPVTHSKVPVKALKAQIKSYLNER